MDLQILKTELDSDPLARGYASMTDAQAADSLNAVNRTVDTETVQGWELWGATVLTEYSALTAAQRDFWNALVGQNAISVKSAAVRANVIALWGAGTTTRANLVALQTKTVSRAEELGLPLVRAAQALMGR